MDEAASGASVAVAERVDGLELGVSHRGLGDGWQIVEVHERDEIFEEIADAALRRGDEGGVDGTQPSSTDPILVAANDTCTSLFGGSFEESAMDVKEIVDADALFSGTEVDCLLHGAHVAEHGSRCHIGGEWFVGS